MAFSRTSQAIALCLSDSGICTRKMMHVSLLLFATLAANPPLLRDVFTSLIPRHQSTVRSVGSSSRQV